MTNEEIWKAQQEHRAHMAAVPEALAQATAAVEYVDDGRKPVSLHASTVRTLLKEVQRLQAALKRANEDMRDEQREAHRAAGEAFSEGRHEGLQEGRGW